MYALVQRSTRPTLSVLFIYWITHRDVRSSPERHSPYTTSLSVLYSRHTHAHTSDARTATNERTRIVSLFLFSSPTRRGLDGQERRRSGFVAASEPFAVPYDTPVAKLCLLRPNAANAATDAANAATTVTDRRYDRLQGRSNSGNAESVAA